jgi:diamine N-acetyltransferase
MQIIPCTSAHIHILSQVALQSYRQHYLHLWHDGGVMYMNKCFTENQFAIELKDTNAAFFLLYYNNQAAGFLKLNINQGLHNISSASALELERIYITKAFTGKGLGKYAINFAIDYAQKLNKKLVWLKSMDSSPSVDFYKKSGFKITGTFRLSFPEMKDNLKGMYIMEKEI